MVSLNKPLLHPPTAYTYLWEGYTMNAQLHYIGDYILATILTNSWEQVPSASRYNAQCYFGDWLERGGYEIKKSNHAFTPLVPPVFWLRID